MFLPFFRQNLLVVAAITSGWSATPTWSVEPSSNPSSAPQAAEASGGNSTTTEPVDERLVTVRLRGLFQQGRVADFRAHLTTAEHFRGEQPVLTLVSIDEDTTLTTFRIDLDRTGLRERTTEQRISWLNDALSHHSRGLFGAWAPYPKPREQLKQIEIPVVGLDCKACGLGAYEAVCQLEGVESATASFREGIVRAWIDPDKTTRQPLEAALRQRGVTVPNAPDASSAP
jgi:hypothetical protein